jgi:hypothetical protein
LRASSPLAAISMPGVQTPHWAAPCAWKARCSAVNAPPAAKPSTVVIDAPSHCPIANRHEQASTPSRWIVQAPQSPALQPTLVPVSPNVSRRTSLSRVAGSPAKVRAPPFTVSGIALHASAMMSDEGGIEFTWPPRTH